MGGLLLWETSAEATEVRGGIAGSGTHLLLLDGQQRITSLYGIIRGKAPGFFEGNERAFTGLYFNVSTELFQFHQPNLMNDDPHWIPVTELFAKGPVAYYPQFSDSEQAQLYLERLNRLYQITEKDFPQEEITGASRTVEEVVEIFNRVNSGGTKLSKGDLALAKVCAQWPEARGEMQGALQKWADVGFSFPLDWLLRNTTAVATGRAVFESLEGIPTETFQQSLDEAVQHVDTFLNTVSGRLGLDHHQVLMGRSAIPVVSRLLHLNGGRFGDAVHRDQVLYWYVHSALWGRFTGPTETYWQQDYDTVANSGVEGLIARLERSRGGNLGIQPHDFDGATKGSRFYPMLYMLTRVHGARDFGSGLELKAELLGRLSSLQVHHIFPKKVLRERYDRKQVNAIANFCFLTQDSNLQISGRHPEEYFAEAERRHPGVLATQWIPLDPELWKVENYPEFLEARRELLARAAEEFLDGLRSGTDSASSEPLRPVTLLPSDEPDDARAAQLNDMVTELHRQGYAEPELETVINDPVTGLMLAEAEAFWPDGLQHGRGNPVVLELDPEQANLPRLQALGYEVFTSVDSLLGFVDRLSREATGEPPTPAAETSPAEPHSPEFTQAVLEQYERARTEAGYHAAHFRGMVTELGSFATARRLLAAPTVSDGFSNLWERGRLDLTVEALVLRPSSPSCSPPRSGTGHGSVCTSSATRHPLKNRFTEHG